MKAVVAILVLVSSNLAPAQTIVCPPGAPSNVKLAAKEIRRYVYLRSGKLLPVSDDPSDRTDQTDRIRLAVDAALKPEQYRLRTTGETLTISGGSDVAVLYGAYAFAEKLGVRFYLHGDVIPDGKIPFVIPPLDETRAPLFETRGILPFHDFPEGPDWWSTDDYRVCVQQLAKMRMNFLGMHSYNWEPLVWRGVADDVADDGTARTVYPAGWFRSTQGNGTWGLRPVKTGGYTAGAAALFTDDDMRSEIEGADGRHFERVAKMLGTTVADAHALGIKVCVGTESPLHIPGPAASRLRELGKTDPAREIYRGMFKWLMKNAPVDYYWIWTPEGWIWGGNTIAQYHAVDSDLKAAQAALADLDTPFPLGTCGWVLGPQQERAAWDELLAKDAPMANINPQAGHAPVDPSFANIQGRPKWAIPWFENDPDMIGYQPWVGRMRYDAVDALRLGCTGLMGIHWRTKILAPNVASLAQAGWDQSWARAERQLKAARRNPGTAVTFTHAVAGTDQDPVYQTLRYGLDGYPVEVPNGSYTLTLKFNEPHHGQVGKRVFGVTVQGRQVAEHLDVFARVGKDHAFDLSVSGVVVTGGVLDIAFVPEVEYPFLSGIEITGITAAANQVAAQPYARRINVGGPAWGDFEADAARADATTGGLERAMPVADFYRDFARAEFGDAVAAAAGEILAGSDGFTTAFNPRYPSFAGTSEWQGGPGALRVIREPWEKVRTEHYAFVEQFAALRPRVTGAGNLERFDYWMNTLRASGLMAQLACQRGALDLAMDMLNVEMDPAERKSRAAAVLDQRLQLARGWEALMLLQIQLVSTPGELGTIANLEQHTRINNRWLTSHDTALAEALGEPLPDECVPAKTYAGPPRLIVPTVRTVITPGETLALKIIALDQQPVKSVAVHVRPLGRGEWKTIPATHVARAVLEAKPPPATEDFEYYITAGQDMIWPATAPEINQTVVIAP